MIKFKSLIGTLCRADFTFYVLPPLMLLLVAGTVAQQDMGLFRAHQMFFSSFVIWVGFVPVPGGYSLTGLLALGLVLKFLFQSEWCWPKAGIILTHFGALILLFGGLITSLTAQEGFMIVPEGAETPYIYDYHQRELFVFEEDALQTRLAFEDLVEGTVDIGLPFEIAILSTCRNCDIQERGTEQGVDFIGMAQFMALFPKEEALEPEENFSGVTLSVQGLSEDQDGIYIAFEGMPKPLILSHAGRVYRIMLGKQQRLLPFSVSLVDFVREVYPGTQKPKDYYSDIVVKDGGLDWPVRIGMNAPLRYKGYTFYQSSFQEGEAMQATILAVVQNKGQIFPYLGALVIAFGLLLHMVLIRRRGQG